MTVLAALLLGSGSLPRSGWGGQSGGTALRPLLGSNHAIGVGCPRADARAFRASHAPDSHRHAPNGAGEASGPLADLPFDRQPGRIWLKATLNGHPVDAILDSGAAGVYAMEGVAARGAKGAPISLFGAGETPAKGWHAEGLELRLDKVVLRVPYILAPAYKEPPRRPIDVIVGFDLLMRYAVEVDYPGSHVRLYPSWAYRPPEGFASLRASFAGRNAVVNAELEIPGLGWRRVRAMLDTGASYGMEISRRMALREGLDERFGGLPVEEGPGGLSGRTQVRRLKGARCRLAGAEFGADARISMTDGGASGAGAAYDVLIGDDVLGRYDLVFHYWRGRVYLKPRDT